MRDRTERFSSFPFSVGCVSQSSVEVIDNQLKKSPNHAPRNQIQASGKMKNSFGLLPLPKPNISAGLQKVIKSFKNLSNIFQLYREDEDEEEIEMEIGFPTNVQHVTHIGWEGFNNGMKSWSKGPDILSLPSLSLRQFELAMVSQANDGPH